MNGLRIGDEAEFMADTVHPSSYLAYRFQGVDLAPGLDMDRRRELVNAFVEVYNLIYRLGWYDHTGDWDFHVGVHLTDGRANDHIGDGASVSFGVGLEVQQGGEVAYKDLVYSGQDEASGVLRVEGPDVWDDPDGGEDEDPFKEFRVSQSEWAIVWEFPIELIASLRFGYCT